MPEYTTAELRDLITRVMESYTGRRVRSVSWVWDFNGATGQDQLAVRATMINGDTIDALVPEDALTDDSPDGTDEIEDVEFASWPPTRR